MSPDWSAKEEPVPYAKLDNPQSLNLYGYVLNNPLTNHDPDGHICFFGIGNTCGGKAPPPPIQTPPPPVDQKAFLASLANQKIKTLTVQQVANVVSNEQRGVTGGKAGSAKLDQAKAAEANAVMNADQRWGQARTQLAGTERSDVNKAPASQASHDLEVVEQAYYNRAVYGQDTAGGRVFIGNSNSDISGRSIGDSRQDTYESYGPFGNAYKNFILIYEDPEKK
jgi:hypothetical protein